MLPETCGLRYTDGRAGRRRDWICTRPAQHAGECSCEDARRGGHPPTEDASPGVGWNPQEARALAGIRTELGCAEGKEIAAVRRLVQERNALRVWFPAVDPLESVVATNETPTRAVFQRWKDG